MCKIENLTKLLDEVQALTGTEIKRSKMEQTSENEIITLIGQPQNGMLDLVFGMMGETNPLGASFIHGYCCSINYGDEKKYFLINGEQREETSAEKLTELLSAFGEIGKPVIFELQLTLPILKGICLRVIASDAEFDDVDAEETVVNSDYCFMTLTATALLAMSERRFLRKVLIPEMGEYLGVLVLRSEMIHETEKQNIANSLESFFKGETPIYYPTERPDELSGAFAELKEKAEELRAACNERLYRIGISKARKEIEDAMEAFGVDEDNLSDAIELIKEKGKSIASRREAASRQCRMKYTSVMKVEYSGELSDFYQKISERIKEEIESSDDIHRTQEIVPGYIRSEWERATTQLMESICSQTEVMERDLAEYIEKDIYSFLADGDNGDTASYIVRLSRLYPDVCFKNKGEEIMIEEAKDNTGLKKGGVIAAGIGLAIIGHPILGAGVAIYGIKKGGQDESLKVLEENKSSLAAAAEKLCTEYYEEAVEWLDNLFNSMNESISACVNESYSNIMDGLLAINADAVKQTLESLERLNAQLSELS